MAECCPTHCVVAGISMTTLLTINCLVCFTELLEAIRFSDFDGKESLLGKLQR